GDYRIASNRVVASAANDQHTVSAVTERGSSRQVRADQVSLHHIARRAGILDDHAASAESAERRRSNRRVVADDIERFWTGAANAIILAGNDNSHVVGIARLIAQRTDTDKIPFDHIAVA